MVFHLDISLIGCAATLFNQCEVPDEQVNDGSGCRGSAFGQYFGTLDQGRGEAQRCRAPARDGGEHGMDRPWDHFLLDGGDQIRDQLDRIRGGPCRLAGPEPSGVVLTFQM